MKSKTITWEALAASLGVTYKTLARWRDGLAGAPQSREAKHWRRFMRETGLHSYSVRQNAPVGKPDDDAPTGHEDERRLRIRERTLRIEREEFELNKAKEAMLPVVEFQAALSAMVSAFVTTIGQVPGRAAMKLTSRVRLAVVDLLRDHLTAAQFAKIEPAIDSAAIDYGDIQRVIEDELNAARRTLAECKFLDDSPGGNSPHA